MGFAIHQVKAPHFLRFSFLILLSLSPWNPYPAFGAEPFDRRTPLVITVEKVGPSVVNIYTLENVSTLNNPFQNFGNGLFDQFLKDFLPPQMSERRSLGSGVIINSQGYILTNEHVIGNALEIKVRLVDQREFNATLVGADSRSDLAIVKIDSQEPLPYVEMGQSEDLMIGETVVAIGNPFGLNHTVTSGIISAVNRTIRAGKNKVFYDFIQVDASINPGNSGGPLLNINGSLIGVNTAIYQKAEGIGFAIPINRARRIVRELMRFGKVRPGWIGLSIQDLTPDLMRHFKLDRQRGVLVTRVFKDGPAGQAGVHPGDVLLSVDDHLVNDGLDYQELMAGYTIGNVAHFKVVRDDGPHVLALNISALPRNFVADFTQNQLGLGIRPVNPDLARQYGLQTGSGMVVVDVQPNGSAGKIGIRPGDVIRQVDQHPVKNEEDYNQAVMEVGDRTSVLLLVQRGRYGYYVTLEM
ncbi:MAG: serine protease Do [Nitrospinae bacterium CG11_big_fil_rev_8_21_14_0_20_56_8]|nr:MAG: serine protease Do [Nitrospinae bacterium CG11_big_fil_rev_8_21_14_0_20_56_8]